MTQQPENGSTWRKWDLHVHTPLSYLNNQFPSKDGKPDWDAYAKALEESDLSVVGVTDYFSIDGYKALRKLREQGRLQNIQALLPNIEFRLEQVVSSRSDHTPRRLNFHVIFSDELSPDVIEEHFLHDVEFCYEGNPGQKDEKWKLKRSNLEALGTRLLREQPTFKGSAIEVAATTAVVDHKQISELLASDARFEGRYVLVFPEELSSLIDWNGQDHMVRKVILQKSHMVFSPNPKTRDWCLGLPPYSGGSEKFVQEFSSLKACIHGSDAHDLARIGKPCRKRGESTHQCDGSDCELRHCWIKADPTFEGLRQLLYEPGSRVRIGAEDPTPPRPGYTIGEINLSGAEISDDLTMAPRTLHLNSGLVAVTGGKGGGKTAFVDLIANCYENRVGTGDSNSFVARIADAQPSLDVSLTFLNGQTFKKGILDGSLHEDSSIVYIAQGALEEYVSEASTLSAHIEDLLLTSPAVSDSVLRFQLSAITEEVKDLDQALASRNADIASLEARAPAAKRATIELELKKKQSELADVEAMVIAVRKRLAPERQAEAEAKQKSLGELRDRASVIKEQRELLRSAVTLVGSSTARFDELRAKINANLVRLGKTDVLPAFEYPAEGLLESLRSENEAAGLAAATAIESETKALAGLSADAEAHARALDLKKRTEVELHALSTAVAECDAIAKHLESLRASRRESFGKLLTAILQQRDRYEELIGVFTASKDRVLADLEFKFDLKLDEDDLRARASEVLDQRKAAVLPLDTRGDVLAGFIASARRVIEQGEAAIEPFLDEAERIVEMLRSKMRSARTVSESALYELVFHNYLRSQPIVRYKRTPLSKLSLGQKATVLIKIHLAHGTRPIIIDSHDDHLDNEFIMDELVQAIRQAKEYRQVILVSNNGNVVVNSDAEQVVIAERTETTIEYRAGALENPGIRDRLIEVLEGGREAFSKRQRKYRLS